MSDPVSDMRDKYVEVLAGSISVPHAILFLCFLLALIASDSPHEDGVYSAIASFQLSTVFSSEDGLLWQSTLRDLLFALGMTLISGYLGHALKIFSYSFCSAIIPADEYADRLAQAAGSPATRTRSPVQTFDAEMKRRERELRRRSGISEILLGGACIPAFFFLDANIIDVLMALVCLLGALAMQFSAYRFYVARYLPILTASKTTSGASAVFGDGYIDAERDVWMERRAHRRPGSNP